MAGTFSYQKERVEKLRELMAENKIDAFLVPTGPNFFYFTGFETESHERLTLMFISRDEHFILAPKLMEEQLHLHTWIDDVRPWTDEQNPHRIARDYLEKTNASTVAIDGLLPYFHYAPLFHNSNSQEILGDSYTSALRMVKDREEMENISTAVRKSEESLKDTLDFVSEGVTEKSVAVKLAENFEKRGLDVPAFESIVAAGENSSVPHHTPSERKIARYEPIIIDFGGRYRGYASDTTRTLYIDRAAPEMEEIYEVNREAQETTIESLNPETTYADADRIAREIISRKGYGNNFIHRLGHGLGISVHEDPYLVPDNKKPMIENSVFTIEPGIYLPGKGGVRIEDTVYFQNGKCKPFNTFPKSITYI